MSDAKFSLINFDGLGEVGSAFVNRLADFIDAERAPARIRKNAEAQADAAYTQAVSDVAVAGVQRRAQIRAQHETVRHQLNIDSIVAKALPELTEGSKPEALEDDWLAFVFERARLVSDERMQSVWAKVLAGEAQARGSFSRRAIDVVALMEHEDAHLFTKVCSFIWDFGELDLFVHPFPDPVFEARGITLKRLMHLEDIGLVKLSGFTGFHSNELSGPFRMGYAGAQFLLTPSKVPTKFQRGKAVLTAAGRQLAAIAGGVPDPKYLEHCIEQFQKQGFTVQHFP